MFNLITETGYMQQQKKTLNSSLADLGKHPIIT